MQINEFSANLFYPQPNMLSSFPQYDVVDYSDDQLSATSDPPFPAPHHVCASGVGGVVREQMFEKPLTPSDVGKLNRLVIPKQHAEKYFPIHGVCSGGDDGGGGGDKGGLLCFEDESGKSWRFRYSYWNSSQSYVLTKGWSRYVKEKKLDAGDVVLFERHPSVTDRFFIGWRRRGTVVPAVESRPVLYNAYRGDTQQGIIGPPSPYQQQPPSLHSHGPKRAPQGNTKRRLRLFGVNLECQLDDDEDDMAEPQTSDGGSSLSSHPGPVAPPPSTAAAYPSFFDYYGSTAAHYPHLGMNFTEDVSQMRNRLG